MKTAAAILCLLAAAPQAWARTITVSKDGNADYKTIYEGLDHAGAGDTVDFKDIGRFGAQIAKDGRTFLVDKVLPGTAADNAGLKAGDRIVAIEREEVAPLSIDEAIARMRGKQGTTLRLQVQRAGRDGAEVVEAVRTAASFPITDDASKASIARGLGDFEAMNKLLEKPARLGNSKAQCELGWSYQEGRGVAKDLKQAARWIKACADSGNPVGQRLYGVLLASGSGVSKDLKASVSWLTKAADQKDAWAYINLGRAYHYGQGVPADPAAAEAWYTKALDAGVAEAKQQLELLKASQTASAKPAEDYRQRLSDAQDRERRRAAIMDVEAKNQRELLPPAQPGSNLSAADVRRMIAESREAKVEAPAPARSDVDAPSYHKDEREDDLAVVIGVEKYQDLPAATYAEHDAEAVRAHLIALGFPERNVFFLKGQQATKSAMSKELEARLSRLVTANSTVFVYFSGHGAPDPKSGDAYLMPFDGDPQFLEETGYPLKRLYAKLGALKAKRVIVALDSCFSGAGGRSVLAKGVRPLVAKVDIAPRSIGKVVALTAAGGNEISGTLDEQGHGLFTYYLLKGLNDGKTKLGALENYLKPKVENEARRQNRDQTPQLVGADAAETELGK